MNRHLYHHYLAQYVKQAIHDSDGSIRSVAELLHEKKVKGLFVLHRTEKLRALSDARAAFDDHRHWPIEILLSHLGIAQE